MMGYIENLGRLGYPLSKELATDIILQSLPQSYHQFILNYNMNGLEKSLTELHGMLKSTEQNIRKPNDVLMVEGKSFKKRGKGKAKGKGKAQVENSNKPKSNGKFKPSPGAESQCFYCDETGHWKINCSKLLKSINLVRKSMRPRRRFSGGSFSGCSIGTKDSCGSALRFRC